MDVHDEENKGKEIAFINDMEHQNKLHDLMQLHQNQASRLADMVEERNRKVEEKEVRNQDEVEAAHEDTEDNDSDPERDVRNGEHEL